MKDKVMFILAVGVMVAIGLAIVRDYIVAAIETQATGELIAGTPLTAEEADTLVI